MLRLTTLGAICLTLVPDEGEPQVLLGPGKSLALLTYLAHLPNHSARRDQVVDLLWADVEPETARRNLRQAVYQIRQRLGDDALDAHESLLILRAQLAVDRDEFEAAIAAGHARRAVEQYTGPFFPAFAAPGGAAFEQWADSERRRLQGLFSRALESLVRDALAARHLREAHALWLRLRDADPDREVTRRLGLEVLMSLGDWMQAAAEADALEQWAVERGRPLEPATAQLVRVARQAPETPRETTVALVAELVGREAEFAALVSAWDLARHGGFHHVHVLGAPGLGKTRLLQDAGARIAGLGGRVLYLRANQGERDFEYALAADLVQALADLTGAQQVAPVSAAVLVGLNPALSTRFAAARLATVGPADVPRLRLMAISELLASVTTQDPLALFVEDLHWSDASSRHVVTALRGRVSDCRVLLVTSARPQAGGLEAGQPDETITLRALSVDEVGTLIESIGTVPAGLRARGFYEALATATGGSPLLVLEVLRLALDRHWVAREGDAWVVADEKALMAQLHAGSAIEPRLGALAAHEWRVLALLAAAGRPVPGEVLDAATREIGFEKGSALERLEHAGFVKPQGGAWEPVHDLVAEKALLTATQDELRQARGALGRVWAADPRVGREALAVAARFSAQAGNVGDAARVFGLYERRCRAAGDWRPPQALAVEMLGAGQASLAAEVVRRLAPVRRWRLHVPARVLPLGLVAVAALAVAFAWSTRPPRAERLVIERQPGLVLGQRVQPWLVRVHDRSGREVDRFRDTVRVTLGLGRESWTLSGTVTAVPEHGAVWFDSIVARPRHPDTVPVFTLLATAEGLPPAESDSVFNVGVNFLRLDSAVLNGQRIAAQAPRVKVGPGELIEGHVDMTYRVVGGRAALAVGIPTWGDRRRTFFPVRVVSNAWPRVSERWPLRFRAPVRAGRHLLFLVAALETSVEDIASGTNWAVGEPLWFDGNDIVDVAPDQLTGLWRTGRLRTKVLHLAGPPDYHGTIDRDDARALVAAGRVTMDPTVLPASAIEIVVEEGAGSRT